MLYTRFYNLREIKKQTTKSCSEGIICSFIYRIPLDFTFEIFKMRSEIWTHFPSISTKSVDLMRWLQNLSIWQMRTA